MWRGKAAPAPATAGFQPALEPLAPAGKEEPARRPAVPGAPAPYFPRVAANVTKSSPPVP
ncbi:hypothetical protein LMIY3S_05447 [Labrys miyagiensis]